MARQSILCHRTEAVAHDVIGAQTHEKVLSMIVREFSASDAPAIVDLFQRSVRILGARDYTPAQVDAWAWRAPSCAEVHERYSDGRLAIVVANADGALLGFADIEEDGHIGFFYRAPEAEGTGVAELMFQRLWSDAQGKGLERVYLEASEAARRFFLKQGFVETHRQELLIQSVPIHNYAMHKMLR